MALSEAAVQPAKLRRKLLIGKRVGANPGDQAPSVRWGNRTPSAGLRSRERPRTENPGRNQGAPCRSAAGRFRPAGNPAASPSRNNSLRRSHDCSPTGSQSRLSGSGEAVRTAFRRRVRRAKMSAKAEVGLVREASRQIVAGGSAGKVVVFLPAGGG